MQKIKNSNHLAVYRLFFEYEKLSKPQIAKLLNLSLPTVGNNIAILEKQKMIKEAGFLASQGGRPANAYELVDDFVIAIGIELRETFLKFVAVNLKGKITALETHSLKFQSKPEYFQNVSAMLRRFTEHYQYKNTQIIGIGISIQGIVAKKGNTVLYSKVLSGDNLSTIYIQPFFSQPVKLFHDVKCAATAELWSVNHSESTIYISISEHLGGALIGSNHIDQGKYGYAGALEHIQVGNQKHQCYCGQYDCLETYCSLSSLLQKDETIEIFFTELRAKNKEYIKRWRQFLQMLAKGLLPAYLLLERDIILGGDIAPYLTKEDIDLLQRYVRSNSAFPIIDDFIRIAIVQQNASALGAALHFIKSSRSKLATMSYEQEQW